MKHAYILIENKFKKLQTLDSSVFIGQNYFNSDGAQLHLIFQPIYKPITIFSGLEDTISEWESKGLSNEKCKCTYVTNVSVCPKLIRMNNPKTYILILKEEPEQGLDQTTLTAEAKYSINF